MWQRESERSRRRCDSRGSCVLSLFGEQSCNGKSNVAEYGYDCGVSHRQNSVNRVVDPRFAKRMELTPIDINDPQLPDSRLRVQRPPSTSGLCTRTIAPHRDHRRPALLRRHCQSESSATPTRLAHPCPRTRSRHQPHDRRRSRRLIRNRRNAASRFRSSPPYMS